MNSDSGPRDREPATDEVVSPIASDDAFTAFYTGSIPPLTSWLVKQHPELAPDHLTINELIADAFDELYEKRHDVKGDPFGYLVNELKNVLAKRNTRKMGSLDALRDSADGSSTGSASGDGSNVVGMADPAARTASSLAGSTEVKQIFSLDAIMSLTQEQRELYDLYWVQGKALEEIAQTQGVRKQSVHDRVTAIRVKLAEYMGRLDSEVEQSSRWPLQTRDHAKREIEGLPNPSRDLLRTVYVDDVPLDKAWRRLRFASKEEAVKYLEKGFALLQRKFGQEMPAALENALAQDRKKGS